MKRSMRIASGFVLGALFVGSAHAQDQNAGADEAMKLARKLTEEGAATFNTANAKAMAAAYTDDAKVVLQIRGENGISRKEYDGRGEIEQLYTDLFKDRGTIQSKNTVEYARLLASNVLVIAGTFDPGLDAANPLEIPFYQVRIKQGDKWLVDSLRIFVVAEKK